MVEAAVAMGMSPCDAERQMVVDGRPPPVLGVGKPLLAPYVDNCNCICWDEQDCVQYLGLLESILQRYGLAYRVECSGASRFDTLGLTIDLQQQCIVNKASRLWKTPISSRPARGARKMQWRPHADRLGAHRLQLHVVPPRFGHPEPLVRLCR